MEVKSPRDREQRLNYENFREVCRTHFITGKITNLPLESQDPITLTDTCDVKGESRGFSEVPIFYHCGQNSTIKGTGELVDERVLRGGGMAFRPGVEVKVLLLEDEPVGVIGHADNIPRRCQDLIKLNLIQALNSVAYTKYLQTSSQAEYKAYVEGKSYPLGKKAIRLMGSKEFWYTTLMMLPFLKNYWGDWLIELGPLLYIFQVRGYAGFPAGIYNTHHIQMLAAPYSEDLKQRTIELGKEYEKDYIVDQIMEFAKEFPSDPYPEFVKQTTFSQSLKTMFGGTKSPQPRWLYTEIFTEEVNWGASNVS